MMNWNAYLNYLKLLTRHIVNTAVLFILLTCSIFAQQGNLKSNPQPLSDSVFVMQKSPWGAVLRSAIIPGWGQFYTQSYWKIPIIWGLGSWLAYLWIQNNKFYRDNLNLSNYYFQRFNLSQNYQDKNNALAYLSYKNFYQDQRDLVAIYVGLTYLLNLVDAYVDAQLFDFSVSPNISNKSLMLNMKMNF